MDVVATPLPIHQLPNKLYNTDEDYEAYEQDELQFFQQQEGYVTAPYSSVDVHVLIISYSDDEWNVVQKKKSDKAKEKPTTLIIGVVFFSSTAYS